MGCRTTTPSFAHSWITAVSAINPFWFVVNMENSVPLAPDGVRCQTESRMETAAAAGRTGRRRHAGRERLLVPIRYALLRLRRHVPRTALVAAGIAVGAAVLAMTAVGSASVQ